MLAVLKQQLSVPKSRTARGAMFGLAVGLPLFAYSQGGRSAESVDVRTYIEMVPGEISHAP